MKVVCQREYVKKYYQKYMQGEAIKYLIKDKSIFHWVSGRVTDPHIELSSPAFLHSLLEPSPPCTCSLTFIVCTISTLNRCKINFDTIFFICNIITHGVIGTVFNHRFSHLE